MSEKIQVSNANAKWFAAWKKRMESGTPREGDYNFVLFKGKDGIVYDPPANDEAPSIFLNGKWNVLEEN